MESDGKGAKTQPLIAGQNNAQRKVALVKRKGVFLAAYEEWGTTRAACRAAGISRSSYERWHQEDGEFVKELDRVKLAFAESLEELALERIRNPDKNRGSDVLLIGLLNANMPQKYRPQFNMSEDTAKDLITEWRKAAKDAKDAKPEQQADLPDRVEDTLQEILERRGAAPSEKNEKTDDPETT